MTKICEVCGLDVKKQCHKDYNIYTMYQAVDVYEDGEDNSKEMRPQLIKYICRECRVNNSLFRDTNSDPQPWKVIS